MENELHLIAAALLNKGIVLEFKDNSIFNILYNELVSDSDSPDAENEQLDTIGLTTDLIINEVNSIKNKYLPIVNTYADVVETKIREKSVTSSLAKYDICQLEIPDIAHELVDVTKQMVNVNLPDSGLEMPSLQPDDIRELVKFKSSEANMLLEEIMFKYNDDKLNTIWNKYITNISSFNMNIPELSNVINIDDLILVYIIVEKLLANKYDGVIASDEKYKQTLNIYSKYLEFILVNSNKTLISYSESDRLIARANNNTVYVVKSVYDKYLNSGGTPEAVLGVMFVKDMDFKYNNLNSFLANIEMFNTAYKQAEKIEAIRLNNVNIVNTKLAYESGIREVMATLDIDTTTGDFYASKDDLPSVVRDFVDNIPANELSNVYDMCMRIVRSLVVNNNVFYTFTKNMLNYQQTQHELSAKEIATLATLDIIIDYHLAQVKTTK